MIMEIPNIEYQLIRILHHKVYPMESLYSKTLIKFKKKGYFRMLILSI